MKNFKSIAKDGTIAVRQSNNNYISALWSIDKNGKHELSAMSSSNARIGNQSWLESLGFTFYKTTVEEITKEEYKNIKDFNKRKHLIHYSNPIDKIFA